MSQHDLVMIQGQYKLESSLQMNIPGFTIVGSTKIENRDYFPMGPVKIGLIPLFDTPRVVVSWG